MLKDLNIEVKSLKDVYDDVPDIVEDGKTFEENAIIKAKAIAELTDAIVIGQGVGANALAALASGLMGCNAGGGSFGVRVECSVFEKYKV